MLEQKDTYLTEQKLGEILKKIFPNCTIASQVKRGRHKTDYVVHLKKDLEHSIKKILPFKKEEINKDFELFIEYDGHHHFTSDRRYLSDKKAYSLLQLNSNWIRFDEGKFILRIPYFVQLDAIMTRYWFNIEGSFNVGFPHGFISKKIAFPECFSTLGTQRVLDIFNSIPKSIVKEIFDNLSIRMKKENKPENYEMYAPKVLWDFYRKLL